DDLLSWHRTLAKKGWIAPHWPKDWGGTDWTVVQRYIFEEECGAAGTPPIVPFGVRMCAPVLLRFGTDAQKQRFLPRMYNGEDFFDDVKVPAGNLVHEENRGWTVAKFLLGYERMGTGNIAVCKRELARVKELAARAGLLDDPRFGDRLTRVEVELMALEITNLRFLDQLRGGRPPGADVSLLKIKGTEIQQALTE